MNLILITTLLLWANVAYCVVGDLNKDGVVNFGDFFILADNFGKEGVPEPPDTIVYTSTEVIIDTTVTYISSVCGATMYVSPPPGLSGSIESV